MVRMEPVEPESDWMLRLSVDDGIATLTLDRPDKLNAWSWEASRQLGKRADEIRFDDEVRVVVVRAEGRAFCAGVDLGMPEDRVTGRPITAVVPSGDTDWRSTIGRSITRRRPLPSRRTSSRKFR